VPFDPGPSREDALVLRSLKLGDTSKIVTVLTEAYGRVKLVAKGARRLESRWSSLLEPGNEVEVVAYVRPERDLWTLSDVSLRRSALTGGNSLDKLSHLFAALELADRLLPEQQPVPELATLYRTYLDRWHGGEPAVMPALFFGLELAMLRLLGLELGVTSCNECGAALAARPRALYRAVEGALCCERCARGDGRWLDPAALGVLAQLESGLQTAAPPPLEDPIRAAVGRLLHEHMSFHLPSYRVPRSLYWLADATRGG
jgi:DNA repair protein RecO (recombination protein O)